MLLKNKKLGLIDLRKRNKKLVIRKTNKGGRNSTTGRICIRNRGNRHRKLVRLVDFKRLEPNLQIKKLVYDPIRTAFLLDCFSSYILAPDISNFYRILKSKTNILKPLNGDCTILANLPVNSFVHNIEMKPGKGGQMVRSSGNFAKIIEKNAKYAKIRLSSGEERFFPLNCKATFGKLYDLKVDKIKKKKAGNSRWVGRRPIVRGVAKNPVDHPHGGGEGKTSGGRHPVNPLGKLTKGVKTRYKKHTDFLIFKKVN